MFGVFVIRNGQWSLWETYNTLSSAERELDYLVGMLSIRATIFVKQ